MREEILHYLWQHQAFNYAHLQTVSGQPIQILSVGALNLHAGPDFALARLFIDGVEWVGSVEVHIYASDWNRHHHQHNSAYNRVILHVVWEYDQEIFRADGTPVPTLELKNRADPSVLLKIETFFNNRPQDIACAPQVKQVATLIKTTQIERAAAQRLERKAQEILLLTEANQGDWEETAYQWLLRCFGFQVNAEAMLQLAKALPWRWVKKFYTESERLKALLLWQAGLSDAADHTVSIQGKYTAELTCKRMSASVWRYSRMRPANFPHVRIAQVAHLLGQWHADVSWLFQPLPLERYVDKFGPGVPGTFTETLGKKSIENLIINGIVPLLAAHGMFHRDEKCRQHAWQLLESVPPEDHRIIRKYTALSFPRASAVDTQGMVEQYQTYCKKKACLQCSIGSAVMKKHYLFVS